MVGRAAPCPADVGPAQRDDGRSAAAGSEPPPVPGVGVLLPSARGLRRARRRGARRSGRSHIACFPSACRIPWPAPRPARSGPGSTAGGVVAAHEGAAPACADAAPGVPTAAARVAHRTVRAATAPRRAGVPLDGARASRTGEGCSSPAGSPDQAGARPGCPARRADDRHRSREAAGNPRGHARHGRGQAWPLYTAMDELHRLGRHRVRLRAELRARPPHRHGSRKFHHMTGIWRRTSSMIVPLRRRITPRRLVVSSSTGCRSR